MADKSVNRDPQQFSKLGYSVFDDVLEPDEILLTRSQLDHTIANMPEEVEVFSGGEMVKKKSRSEYLTEPHGKDAYWMELCRHPKVLDCVEKVLGPNLTLIMSHLIVKQANDGLAVKWHQDNTYWPSIEGTDIVTVWLAIDDVDLENGCMQVILGSHQGYQEMEKVKTDGNDLLGVETVVSEEDLAQAIPIEMKAGSLSIHDSYILHGSEANTSPRRRAGYTMRYANTKTVKVDVDNHWIDVYLVRGEHGPHTEKYVDIRPGQSLPGLKQV